MTAAIWAVRASISGSGSASGSSSAAGKKRLGTQTLQKSPHWPGGGTEAQARQSSISQTLHLVLSKVVRQQVMQPPCVFWAGRLTLIPALAEQR